MGAKISFFTWIGFLCILISILLFLTGNQIGVIAIPCILLAVSMGRFLFSISVDCLKVVLFYHALKGPHDCSMDDCDSQLEDECNFRISK
jgi:hypothetical protein